MVKILFICIFLFLHNSFSKNSTELRKIEKPIVFSNGLIFLNREALSLSLSVGSLKSREILTAKSTSSRLLSFNLNLNYYYASWFFLSFESLAASDNNLFVKTSVQEAFNYSSFGGGFCFRVKSIGFYLKSSVVFQTEEKNFERSIDLQERIEENNFLQINSGFSVRITSSLHYFSSWKIEFESLPRFSRLETNTDYILGVGSALDLLDFFGYKADASGFIVFTSLKFPINFDKPKFSIRHFTTGVGISF